MEFLVASAIGLLTACGVYLLLRARTFPVVLGLTLLSYAVNLFIFAMGRLAPGRPPIVSAGAAGYTDPLPQALVLTAIVIGFGMTAFTVALAVRANQSLGSDHVDGARDDSGQRGETTERDQAGELGTPGAPSTRAAPGEARR